MDRMPKCRERMNAQERPLQLSSLLATRAIDSFKQRINQEISVKRERQVAIISAIENVIEEKNNIIKNADNDCAKQFNVQDELNERIVETEKEKKSFEEEIVLKQQEKKNLIALKKKQKAIAYVKTTGTLFSRTSIFGPNATLIITKNVKSAKVREVANPGMDSGWEMKIV